MSDMQINAIEVLNGMKKAVSFGMNNLTYSHLNGDLEHKTVLTPANITISAIAGISQTLCFKSGDTGKTELSDFVSGRAQYAIQNGVSTRFSFPFVDVSLGGSEWIYETLKYHFIQLFPGTGKVHISMDSDKRHELFLIDTPRVEYIDDVPEFEVIPLWLKEKCKQFSIDLEKLCGVNDALVTLNHVHIVNFFVDSNGSEVIEFTPRLQIVVDTIIQGNDEVEMEKTFIRRISSFSGVNEQFFSGIVDEIEKVVEIHADMKTLSSGQYPLLLKHSAADVFFHEGVAAHMLSGNYIVNEESTVFTGRLGHLFDSLQGVDICMDPTLEGRYGSYKFDHEGVEAKQVTLIKDGKICSYLTDRVSATQLEMKTKDDKLIYQLLSSTSDISALLQQHVSPKALLRNFKSLEDQLKYLLKKYELGELIASVDDVDTTLDWRSDLSLLTEQSSGHGRVDVWFREDIEGGLHSTKVEARMSNLVIESRQDVHDDLSVDMVTFCKQQGFDHYLEVEAHAGEVDPGTGLFLIHAYQLVEVNVNDGTRETVFPGGTFSISLENFLERILFVGKQNEFHPGVCGAESGFVPVESYVPEVAVWGVPYQSAPEPEIMTDERREYLASKGKGKNGGKSPTLKRRTF